LKQQDTKKIKDFIAGKMSSSAALPGALGVGVSGDAVDDDCEQLGSIISQRYKLLEYLNAGGMGTVFKALQLSTGRVVALKMMRADAFTQEARERFHQEAKIASKLNHPNAVAIYDFGDTSKAQLFFAMEYVHGVGLDRLIEESDRLDLSEVIDIFIQLCELLSEAHANGIIHRDLKPSNILVTQTRKGENIVKVVDFGIAKQADAYEVQSLTQPGEVLGSPRYMSPEQCSGKVVTASTDIYSVGCMLYETLLGVPPHAGANGAETMALHCTERAQKFRKVRPDSNIPLELEKITLTCLNKKPEDRFHSMDELADRLKNYSSEEYGNHAQGTFKKSGTKRQGIPILIGLAAVLLMAALFTKTHFSKIVNNAPKAINQTSLNQPSLNSEQKPKNEFDQKLSDIEKRIHEHPNDPSAYYDKGQLLQDTANRNGAIGALSDAIPLAEQLLFEDNKDLSALHIATWSYQDRAYLLLLNHNYKDAIRDLTRAIELRPGYKQNYTNRAKAYERIGKLDLAKSDFETAEKMPELSSGMDGFSPAKPQP
jgi:serine/threonine protein kinase